MTPDASGHLAARVPRSLLDAQGAVGPTPDDDGCLAVALDWAEGRLTSIVPLDPDRAAAPLPLVLTPLVEPHAHLDKVFTASAFPNREGTMQAALAANRREWTARTAEQVLERGERALQLAWRQGVRAIRSHIDGGGPAARPSWEALRQLQQRWRGRVELQLVLLAPLQFWNTPEGERQAQELAATGGWLGGVLGPPYRFNAAVPQLLLQLLRLAERLGAGVDLHVDESDGPPGRGVALVASTVTEQRLAVPITCSHASSLGLLAGRRLARLCERLAAAELTVVALPTTNLWLLGRRPEGTPRLRPLAPVVALQQAGVTVAVGGDNVQDPWFPGGELDPLALLGLSAMALQLAPWDRQGLAPFTTAASRLLGLAWDGVLRPGAPADLVALGVSDWYGVLARPPQRRVLRQGLWLEPPLSEAPSPLLACCR